MYYGKYIATCSLYRNFTSLLNEISSIIPKLACMPSYEMAKLVDHSGKGQIQSELCSLHQLTPLEPKLALAVAQKTTLCWGVEIAPFEGVRLENSLHTSSTHT